MSIATLQETTSSIGLPVFLTYLADVDTAPPPRLQYQSRLECILRFEWFWALGNVLASQEADDGELPDSGIRGVTYVRDAPDRVLQAGDRRVKADYRMLSRQVPDGVVGIYRAVADGMRFIDRKTLTLTADLGEPVPTTGGGGKQPPELDNLSNILKTFNDQFGNIDWTDEDRVRLVTEEIPAKVADDPAFQNAKKNSDKQNARIEHDKALARVIVGLMQDDTELFKQFSDNESFRRWLTDTVFGLTYDRTSV